MEVSIPKAVGQATNSGEFATISGQAIAGRLTGNLYVFIHFNRQI